MSRLYTINPWDPEWRQKHLPRDPISAALTAGLGFLAAGAGTIGAPLVLASFTTVGAGLFGSLGSLAIGVALSAGAALLSRPAQRSLSAGVNSNEVRLNSRQEVPPVRFIVGEALVGGALFFEECKPPYLYLGVLLSEGPISALVGLQNSQTPIGINYSNYTVLTPPYTNRLFISFRDGSTSQAIDPILAADFPNLPATFRQRQIATLVVKASYGADYTEFQTMWGQAGKPNILAKVRGVAVYDPRDPGQIKPPSRADYATEALYKTAHDAAQATWAWSNNATLIQAWYLLSRFGGRIDAARMRWDKIAESADWDDGLIGTAGRATLGNTSVGTGNYGGYTFVDRSFSLPNGTAVTKLGLYSDGAVTTDVKIVKRNSAGNYDIVASETLDHAGGGWQDVTLSSRYVVPTTGDYHLASYTAAGTRNITATVARAYVAANAAGAGQSFTEDAVAAVLPVRATYATAGGELIKRHTIDGVITAGQEPFSVMQSLLTANRGIVVRSAGEVWIQTAPQAPILTINDEMIVGGIEYRRSQPKRSLVNRVRCRFIDPRQDWQTVDGPVIDDAPWQASDGQLLEASAEFAFTADHRRAQRLTRCHMLDSRLGREITTMVSLDAIARCEFGELDPGRVVTVDSEIMPRINGTYRIMEVGLADGFSALEISLTEYDAAIENDWNPETDEQDFDLPELDVS
jgi:hypothetical protein